MSEDYKLDKFSPLAKLWKTAYDLRIQGHFQLAKEIYSEITQALSENSSKIELKVNSLNELAVCYRALNDFETAMSSSFEALSLATDSAYYIGKADAFHHLGVLSQFSGDFDDALVYFRNSIKINEGIEERKQAIALTLLHIGILARQKGKLDKAEGDMHTAFRLFTLKNTFESQIGTLRVMIQLANLKLLKEKPIEALNSYGEAMTIANDIKNISRYSLISRMSAACYWFMESIEEAKDSFLVSIKEAEHTGRFEDLILSKLWFGVFNWWQNNLEQAVELITQSYQISKLNKTKKQEYLILFYLITLAFERLDLTLLDNFKSSLEELWKNSRKKNQQILIYIEFSRVLKDYAVSNQARYSFGIIRKFEKVLRLSRRHHQENLTFIIYTFMLDRLLQFYVRDNSDSNEIKSQVLKLIKQALLDLKKTDLTLYNYFKIVESLIKVYFELNFSLALNSLSQSQIFFKNKGMTKWVDKLNLLADNYMKKLEKLLELSSSDNKNPDIQNLKALVIEYQEEIHQKISLYLREFRFKVILTKYILNPVLLA